MNEKPKTTRIPVLMPTTLYDQLKTEMIKRNQRSVSAILREILTKYFEEQK